MLSGQLRSRRTRRLLGVLLVALAAVMFAGGGHSSAADGQVPWVPTDAQIQAKIDQAVAACESGGVYDRCSKVGAVTKWHDTGLPDYDRGNAVMIIMEESFLEGDGKTRSIVYAAECSWADFQKSELLAFDGCGGGGATPDQAMARSDMVEGGARYQTGWDLRPLPAAATPTPTSKPSGPLGPCAATIETTSSLKSGDTLSPYANVTSADGSPAQGEITEVWYINGTQANSVTWNGQPAQIVLQLSCQGHAQEFTATFNGTMGPTSATGASSTPEPTGSPEPTATAEPSATAGPSASPSGQPKPSGNTPGLRGVGKVPGPADGTQGLVGMLAPGLIGLLGGLLAGGFGGGTAGTGGPGAPGGKGAAGGATPDKGPGPDGSGAAGGAAATQAAKEKLGFMSNWAGARDNTAFMAAVNDAKASAFDANGNLIPDKYAAALKAIHDAFKPSQDSINATPGDLSIAVSSAPSAIYKTGSAVAGGIKDFAVGTLEGIVTTNNAIGGAIARVGMAAIDTTITVQNAILGIGLEGAQDFGTPGSLGSGGTARAEGAASVADSLTRLRDSLPSLPSMHDIGTRLKDALPGDEYVALRDAWNKGEVTDDALWAVPSAAVKVAQVLLAFEAPTPAGAGAAGAAEAATAARVGSEEEKAAALAAHPEVAAAVSKVETAVSDALQGGKLPNTYQGCRQYLAEHPELAQSCDDALVANGGTGALGNLRGAGAMGTDAHTLLTARLLGHQEEVLNEAGKQLLQEVVDKMPPGQPVPTRFRTLETTEGSRRTVGGAGTGTDLDRAIQGLGGKDASAAEVAALEQRHQALIDQVCADKGLGLDHKSLGTNIYAPPPGRLSAPSAAGTNPESWVRNNALGTKSVGGYHPVNQIDGKSVVGDHVSGYSGRSALTPEQEFATPSLSEGEAQAATAEARAHLQEAVANGNVKDAVKSAARIAKIARMADRTNPATIPNATLMKAAATRDELLQRQILRDAGITDVTDIEGLLEP
jgi:hypothetical protein